MIPKNSLSSPFEVKKEAGISLFYNTVRFGGQCSNLLGEFDPGSERTLAAGFIHASRAIKAPSGVYKAANG